MKPNQRDQDANTVIRAIRDERNRRRAGKIQKMFHAPPSERYIWDNMANGPYAGYDLANEISAVDVLGLMYDLGYHAAKPGAEAVALNEIDRELKAMVSSTPMKADGPHLQMLVAQAHRIITVMTDKGDLRKVIVHEGKA